MKSIIGHDVQSLITFSQGTVTWAKVRASHHGEGRKEDSVGGVYRILLLSLLVLPFMGVYTTNTTSSYLGPALPSSLFPLGPLPQPLSRRGVVLVEGTADAGGAGRFDVLCIPPLRQRLPERGAQ